MNRLRLLTVLLLATTAARADITTVDVTGHVAPYTWDGRTFVSAPLIDNGTFGSIGTNLFGAAFIAHWVVNTDNAFSGCGLEHCSGDYINGGTIYTPDTVSPIVSATLTINGHSVSYDPTRYGVTFTYHRSSYQEPWGAYDSFYISVTEVSGQRAMNQFVDSFYSLGGGDVFPSSIDAPLNYVVNPVSDNPNHLGGAFTYGGLRGYLYTETVTRTNPTYGVPGQIVGAGLPGLALLAGWWWGLRRKQSLEGQMKRCDLTPFVGRRVRLIQDVEGR